MCGIAIGINGKFDVVENMIGAMLHRGTNPPITEKLCNGFFTIGHVRLPIQGLSPKYSSPYKYKNLVGAFVGEIFNFRDLHCCAESDIQVLMEGFSELGENCFKQFDGFWSVAIYDKKTKELHIFTDDLAKKPLYIRFYQGAVYIASEIKALATNSLPKPTIDEIYMSGARKWGYVVDGRTPFNEIKKIPAGLHIIFPFKKPPIARPLHFIKPSSKFHIFNGLRKAVKNRLVSDVPVSLLLSGGLDSTIIFTIMTEYTENFTIYHVDNEEEEFLNYLRIPPGVSVKKLLLGENVPIQEILFWNETPVDLGSVIPQYRLSRAIKEDGMHVAISGDGADELFGGYRRASEYDSQWSDLFHEVVEYHLPRLDKLMMANTIELRSPFLSRSVIEGALSLPWPERRNKEYLKQLFQYVVPREILDRKKKPLKTKAILVDKVSQRENMISTFRRMHNEY